MRSRLAALLVLLLVLVTPSTHPQDSKSPPKKLSVAAERWIERTLKRMTTDEKIGQVVFPTYFGAFYSAESEGYRELMRRVERDHIGGFILATRTGPKGVERSTVYATAMLTNELQRKAKIPLLIGADFEHGVVMRIIEGTSFPEQMAVGATGRPDDAYAMGRISAIEARAAGVHWLYAPVSDVNSNPDNPIINVRSFGEDPHKVSEFVSAFVRGVEENGALSTAKHFPGHGDTGTDSHLDLALVKGDRARLDAVELMPFRSAISAGVSSIMTGHLVVPALEPDPELPATLSPKVLTELLRKEMNFDGLVVTDALDMGGVTNHYAPAEIAVRAFTAGADVLLMPPVPDAALLAMKDAVASGRIPKLRLDDAVRRVLRAKARLGLDKQRLVDVDMLNTIYGRPEFARAAQDIADRGVTLLRDDEKLIPVDARKPLRTLLVAISADPDTTPGYDFIRGVKAELDTMDVVSVDSRFFRPDTVTIPPPANYDLVILALSVRVADRKGTVGLPADQAALVHRLLASGKPTVVASFGSPYLIEGFPEAKTWLAVFDTNDVGHRAAARALLGDVGITGKLPVRLPGAQPHALAVGDGLTTAADPMTLRPASPEMLARLKPAFDLLDGFSADGVRGTLYVVHRGNLAVLSTEVPNKTALDEGDIFYKPYISTELGILLSEKRLTLETPIYRILPEWASGPDTERRMKVTVRNLLENTSGVPSIIEPANLPSKGDPFTAALAVPLAANPGTVFAPTAVNSILLDSIVTRLTGQQYSRFAWNEVVTPLRSTLRAMASQPHSDLAALGQLWLNGGIYNHHRFFPRVIGEQLITHRELNGKTFTGGWNCPSEDLGTSKYFSARTYGYGGSWNESLWIDPENDLVIVIHLSLPIVQFEVTRLVKLRTQLHDAVIEGLGIAPPH
jgi:beta-glucosidase-like glycosyl hydrolase